MDGREPLCDGHQIFRSVVGLTQGIVQDIRCPADADLPVLCGCRQIMGFGSAKQTIMVIKKLIIPFIKTVQIADNVKLMLPVLFRE